MVHFCGYLALHVIKPLQYVCLTLIYLVKQDLIDSLNQIVHLYDSYITHEIITIIHPTQLFSHHLNIFVSQLTRELCSFCNSWRYLLSISTDTRLPNNVVHLTSSFQMALFLSIMYIWYLVVAKNNRFEFFDHKNLIFPMYMWNQAYCTCWLQKNFLKFQAFATQDRMSKKVIDGIYNMCMYVNSKIA